MISFWEVMDRAINSGPLMKMKEFDLKVYKTASRLVKEYEIRYDPGRPIPSDDDLADRLFQAGLRLYAEVGTYCIDTERVMQFSREELEEALRDLSRMPDWIEIGEGIERRVLRKRGISDPRMPLVIGGVVESNPREGRDFVQMYKSIAQESIIDGIYYGPAPKSIEGRKWLLGSPLDCHAARSAVGWMREALRAVGRPGLHLLDACPSSLGSISACDPERGLRRTDAISIPTISELKVNFEGLNKVAYSLHYGCLRNPFWTSIIGGFAGGPEGAAVLCVASAFNAILVYRVAGSGYVCNAGLLQNPAVNTARSTLWVRNVSLQSLARNTNLICGGGGLTAAGPGTEQSLWEIAALPLRAPTAYLLWRRGHDIFRLKVSREKLARLNVLGFGGGVLERVANDHLVAALLRGTLDGPDQLSEKGVLNVGDQDAYGARPLGAETTRNQIGTVLELGDSLQHPRA